MIENKRINIVMNNFNRLLSLYIVFIYRKRNKYIIIESSQKILRFQKNAYICNVIKKQRIIKYYTIYLERKDGHGMYRYLIFVCEAANFYKDLEAAETKIEKLKLKTDINYEVTRLEKYDGQGA